MTSTDGQPDWGQQPPQDLDAEMATLGAMLLSKDAIADVVEVLSPADFYRPSHQAIFDAVLALYTEGEPADPVTVARKLGTGLKRAGGAPYLVTLTQTVPTAASASYYAQMVADMAAMRRLVEAGTRITQYGYAGADGHDVAEIRQRAQQEVYDACRGHDRSEVWGMNRALESVHAELTRIEEGSGIGGVPTGYRDLDELTHGLHPGELIIVAARPGIGKSTVGTDFLRSAAIMHKLPSVLFSLEMGRNECMMRVLAAETKIKVTAMRGGKLNDEEWARLTARMHEIADRPLFIDDAAGLTMMEIRAKARRLKQQHGLRLIVVDYLQLMTTGKRVESRQQEVSEMSRQLKLLAKELEVPVVALSQLNRNPEARADKRPMLSDLRESGAIEQDADMVILMHRPDYYDADDPRGGEADLDLGKHRNGPTGRVTVAHQLWCSRFSDMAPTWQDSRDFSGT